MLWTGSLPGTSRDFDEKEFLRQRDGQDSESDAESGQAGPGASSAERPGQHGGTHELPGQQESQLAKTK